MPEDDRRALGDDRIERVNGDEITLIARHDKGWVGRVWRGPLGADHPGTCVDWDGALFEVILTQASPGGVKYVLRPWTETDTIRVMARYEGSAEADRDAKRIDHQRRDRTGRLLTWLAPLTGHAPGEVQQRWQQDYGVSGPLITIISAVPLLLSGGIALIAQMAAGFGGVQAALGIPPGLRLLGSYLFFESLIRIGIVLSSGTPAGSLAGHLVAFVWSLTTRKPLLRKETPRQSRSDRELRNMVTREIGRALETNEGSREPKTARGPLGVKIDEETRRHDLFLMTEALLAFLKPPEQTELQQRWGFDPILWGKRTAWTILVFAGFGVVAGIPTLLASGRFSAFLSILVAGAIAAEQISRLARLSRNSPAGSILGSAVRPFVARLFEPKESPPESK